MDRHGLDNKEIRMGFIKKVYGILSVQLTLTTCMVFVVMYSPSIAQIMINPTLLTTVLVLYISSICALVCCRLDKQVPINYILLAVFTVCCSWLVSLICLAYPPVIVFEAICLTAAVVVAITFYAATTKDDFTVCGPIVWVVGMIIMTGSILAIFMGPSGRLLYCMMGVLLFSFYLIIDTQLIIGGSKRQYQIDEDSYIIASLLLYLDIINLFLEILKLLGKK